MSGWKKLIEYSHAQYEYIFKFVFGDDIRTLVVHVNDNSGNYE